MYVCMYVCMYACMYVCICIPLDRKPASMHCAVDEIQISENCSDGIGCSTSTKPGGRLKLQPSRDRKQAAIRRKSVYQANIIKHCLALAKSGVS